MCELRKQKNCDTKALMTKRVLRSVYRLEARRYSMKNLGFVGPSLFLSHSFFTQFRWLVGRTMAHGRPVVRPLLKRTLAVGKYRHSRFPHSVGMPVLVVVLHNVKIAIPHCLAGSPFRLCFLFRFSLRRRDPFINVEY